MAALLAIVLPLGLDTFALSIALGTSGLGARERLRVSMILAAFEGGMPLVGLALGRAATGVIGGYAEITAGLLLIAVGVAMLREDAGDEDGRSRRLASAPGSSAWDSRSPSTSSQSASPSVSSPSTHHLP